MPFELPIPDKTSLRRILFGRLAGILDDSPNKLFDQTYWYNVYFEGIDYFITTPRDIVRLTNALSVTYPVVKGEVNPIDFIAVETLRLFCPVVYDIIRKNPAAFAGHIDTYGPATDVNAIKSFHNSWINHVKEEARESVKRLLMHIFPKLKAVWSNIRNDANWESTWRKQLRICSQDIFSTYFRLAIPEGSISNTEMKAILTLAYDANAFGAKLIELSNQKCPDGTSRVSVFLDRLEDYTNKEIESKYIPSILEAFFCVGDQLLRPEDEQPGIFSFGIDIRIGRIIWRLLERIRDETERFEVLKKAMEKGEAFVTIVGEVVSLGQQHGKYGANQLSPEEERLISAQHLQELEKIALNKVRDAAKGDRLIQVPHLPLILHCWRDWAGEEEEEVKGWVRRVICDDEGLVKFLEQFLQKIFRLSPSDGDAVIYRLDLQQLEPFLNPSEIIDRVKRVAEKTGLTETQRIAVNKFIQEYEIAQQRKNPDNLLY